MPGWEVLGQEELDAIQEWWHASGAVMMAHGNDARRNGIFKVREFERAFAEGHGIAHAQAVSSGSTALLVALRALGVEPGDEVITQSFTFIATVEAILEAGAVPVIAPVDDSLNLDPARLEEHVTKRTRAVIPVHMAGAPADLDPILDVARRHDLVVLEDTAQALGGSYKGRPLGTIGDAGAFSFDFAKNITSGEGGMIVTADAGVWERARAGHDHGHEYNPDFPRGRDTRSRPGFNYRMSEIHAVIGLVQLGKLDHIVATQRANYAMLEERLADLDVEPRRIHDADGHIGDTFIFFLEDERRAAATAERLGELGVATKNLPDAIDWHFVATFTHLGDRLPMLREAECACYGASRDCACGSQLRRAIALPVNVGTDEAEVERVAAAVREALSVAV
jgi:8-amino-3,8-dideoxy-alpha-D-manno-octulosonate transaminase